MCPRTHAVNTSVLYRSSSVGLVSTSEQCDECVLLFLLLVSRFQRFGPQSGGLCSYSRKEHYDRLDSVHLSVLSMKLIYTRVEQGGELFFL